VATTSLGQLTAEIQRLNPWWRDPRGWSAKDPDLRSAAQSGLDYRPGAMADLEPGGLYLLRGPRRVGKTVTMKQAIQDLLARNVPPLAIVRLAADGWEAKNLRTAIQNAPLAPLPPGVARWWFIDEVSAVTGDWAAEIKWLRDNLAEFAEAVVVLTGSSAQSLTRGAGTLAGRRGKVDRTDRTLMPMGFRAFASIWHPALTDLPVLLLSEIHSPSGADAYTAASMWLADLLPIWEAYLHYGGFPAAVAAAKAAHPIPKWFVDTLFDVVHKDAFASSNLDETQTAQLVERVWASMTTPLNQSSIGADIGVHHDVVGRHLDSLRDAYLLWSVQQLDHEWIGLPRAMDKVYPVDPLIGRLAHLRSNSRSDLDITVLAESQIGMAIQRAHLAAGADWAGEKPLFYLRTPTRKEVDFVGEALAGAAVEGKYTEGGRWLREAATVNASRYRGILTTRNVLDTSAGASGAWAVPACVLAVLIDAQQTW
jgi:predicted AAA+ superfamily ATPase